MSLSPTKRSDGAIRGLICGVDEPVIHIRDRKRVYKRSSSYGDWFRDSPLLLDAAFVSETRQRDERLVDPRSMPPE